MAGIDKMYLTYDDFDDLRTWAIMYYPKLFRYMYRPFVSRTEFEEQQKQNHENRKRCAINNYEHYDGAHGVDAVYENLRKEDGAHGNAYVPSSQLKWWREDALDIVKQYNDVMMSDYDNSWDEEKIACTNTPLSIDKYLLWHCPLSCVQEYLNERCGYKTKWYHKLFWKGKKLFY